MIVIEGNIKGSNPAQLNGYPGYGVSSPGKLLCFQWLAAAANRETKISLEILFDIFESFWGLCKMSEKGVGFKEFSQ